MRRVRIQSHNSIKRRHFPLMLCTKLSILSEESCSVFVMQMNFLYAAMRAHLSWTAERHEKLFIRKNLLSSWNLILFKWLENVLFLAHLFEHVLFFNTRVYFINFLQNFLLYKMVTFLPPSHVTLLVHTIYQFNSELPYLITIILIVQ